MAEHTPGPWREGKCCASIVAGPEPDDACRHYVSDQEAAFYGGELVAESVNEADRPLIIAAPDLLAACEAMKAFLYDIEHEGVTNYALMQQIKAAIAKAHGEEVQDA